MKILFRPTLVANLLHLMIQTEAFMPFDWREAHLGASGVSHKAMTRNAYDQLAKEFWPDIKKPTGTMIRARNTWALANGRVDEEVTTPNAHCDGEDFEGCNNMILDLRQKTIDALQANQKKVVAAQESLGKALHPLQDFYAHSNWIEMNNGPVVHPKLGVKLKYPNEKPIPNPDPTISTCSLCKPHNYTGEEFLCQALCLKGDGLITVYDQLAMANLSLPMGLTSYIIDGIRALPSAVQREYCREDCICHDCNQAVFTTTLTSGYSSEEWKTRPIPTQNGVFKCVHGGHSDALGRTLDGRFGGMPYIDPFVQQAYDGINKDSLDCSWSPHGPKWHKPAAEAAVRATVKFVREIAAELDPLELKLLFGVGPSIAFAIDTTASMGPILYNITGEIAQIIDHRYGQIDEPALYVLSEINDPGTPLAAVKAETIAWKFKADLLALHPRGGADCGAYSMAAALNALNQTGTGADLFIITDSDVKDPLLEREVAKMALRKGIRIWPFVFSGCTGSGSSFIYERIAKATHGQAFQELKPSQTVLITKIADNIVRANAVSILSSDVNFFSVLSYLEEYFLDGYGLLDALIAVNNLKSMADLTGKIADFLGVKDWFGWLWGGQPFKTPYTTPPRGSWWRRAVPSTQTLSHFIPVDSAMSQVTIQLDGNATISRLWRPNGAPLPKDDSSVSFIIFKDGAIVTIKRPLPGFWLLTLDAQDDYSLSVTGISDLHYSSFAFVRTKGRPGHQGFDAIEGDPEPGVEHPVMATMDGDFADCMFACCTLDGQMKQNYTLRAGSGEFGEPEKNIHFGVMRVPKEKVNNYAYGFDLAGKPYQRVFNR